MKTNLIVNSHDILIESISSLKFIENNDLVHYNIIINNINYNIWKNTEANMYIEVCFVKIQQDEDSHADYINIINNRGILEKNVKEVIEIITQEELELDGSCYYNDGKELTYWFYNDLNDEYYRKIMINNAYMKHFKVINYLWATQSLLYLDMLIDAFFDKDFIELSRCNKQLSYYHDIYLEAMQNEQIFKK